MSYKSENWKDKLDEVRNYVEPRKDGTLEKTAEDIISDEIEALVAHLEEDLSTEDTLPEVEDIEEFIVEEGMGDKISKLFKTKDKKEVNGIANLMNMTDVKVLQAMQKQNPKGFKRMTAKMGELPAMEEVQEEVIEENTSLEKTVEKLTEKNMLGRLAKSLRLDEEGKEKMFDYFKKGELEQ
jgi:hypothetical protein